MSKLTDRKLVQLLSSLASFYNDEANPNNKTNEELNHFVCYLTSKGGPYADLDADEKEKVWQVLDVFKDAVGVEADRSDRIVVALKNRLTVNYYTQYFYPRSGSHNTFIFINTSPSAHAHHGTRSGGCCGNADGETVLFLIALAIMMALSVAASIYVIRQMANDLERIIYQEGVFQAVCSMTLTVGMAFAMGLFFNAILTGALTAFLVSISFANPVVFALLTVACLTTIATALLNPVQQSMQRKATAYFNPEALDPSDPYRFTLTERESNDLVDKGIDPLRVRCALVALHASLNGESTHLYQEYAFFEERSSHVQIILNKVRGLRSGVLDRVTINKLTIDCKKKPYPEVVYVEVQSSAPPLSAHNMEIPVAKPVSDDQESVCIASAPPISAMALT